MAKAARYLGEALLQSVIGSAALIACIEATNAAIMYRHRRG